MKSRCFISALMLSSFLLLALQPIADVYAADTRPALPISELLNADGTINLAAGYSGSVNVDNYSVRLDPVHGPVFSQSMTVNAWTSLGGGLNNIVYAIAISGSNVYMGGQFTDAGGDANADRIARWNGSTWSALGSGISNGQVNALAFKGSVLYVGGNFTNAGGVSGANYIAQWDGSSWATLGDGLGNTVNAVSVTGSDTYVAGNFINAGVDINADYIAKLDGGTWAALGSTPLTGPVNTIAVAGASVYAGGDFLNVGGNPAIDRIALWDGTSWSPLGGGLGATVASIALSGSDVYAAGLFNDAGGISSADKIAKWDGTSWSALGNGLNSFVNSIVINGPNIYAGGNFLNAGGDANADYIARWDGTAWSALNTTPLNNTVSALGINGLNLYVGGIFNDAGGDPSGDKIVLLELDGTAPTVVSFSATSPTNSLNIPITAFSASDNAAVTGYTITEDNTPPAASAAGWTISPPSFYAVASAGSYTLYPWAKDASGNVSAVYGGAPFIVTVDTSAPVIVINNPNTSPAISKTLTASASDGTLTMRNTRALACDNSLTFIPYASQTFVTAADNGIRVCYRAVDAAGNIAYSLSNAIAGIVEPSTTTITSHTPAPTVVGQSYLVSVTVTGVSESPLGTVTIRDGALGSPSCGPVALTAGTAPNSSASCTLTSTSAGTKTLTATYTADSGAAASASSGTAIHQVNAAATTISVTGPARSRITAATMFDFTLTVSAPGAGSPAGTVTLSSGTSTCNVTVPTTNPRCALSFPTLGARTVHAAFVPSNVDFMASSSSGAGGAQTLVFARADIAVTNSNGVDIYYPGELIVYTITVGNLSGDTALNVRVRDTIPAGLTNVVWSCDASAGTACPQSGGTADIDATVASLPTGELLTYTLSGNVLGMPTDIVNTAFVGLPADTTVEDPQLSNNTATDTDQPDGLFRDGFDSVAVTVPSGFEGTAIDAPNGSLSLPSADLREVLSPVAITLFSLSDTEGEALRVYLRQFDGQLQLALAQRASSGLLRLAEWHTYPGDATLSWSAHAVGDGWVLDRAELSGGGRP